MSRELPQDLDPQANDMAKISAVAGTFQDLGVEGVLANPDIVSSVSNVIAESAKPLTLERELFLEGVTSEVMVEHGVDRLEAMKMITGTLSELLIEKLEDLRQAETSIDVNPEQEV